MFWAPIIAAGISAAASTGGSILSASGAAAANAQNANLQNQANMFNQNFQLAQHEQNTAFQEDAQAHQIWSQHMANEFNMTEAAKHRAWSSAEADQARHVQMDFQTRMANTAYQRAMADMKAAGLNPILAYQQGGASAMTGSAAMPSGSAASGSGGSAGMASMGGAGGSRAAHMINDKETMGRALGNIVNSAVDAAKVVQGVRNLESQEKLTDEQTRKVGYETGQLDAQTGKTLADTNVSKQQEQNLQVENAILRANAITAVQNARVAAADAEATERYGGKYAPGTLERILRSIQGSVENSTFDPGALERGARKYFPDPEAVKREYHERMQRKAPWEK